MFYQVSEDGSLSGAFASPQPDNPLVIELPDDDPRVVAFRAGLAASVVPPSCTKLGLKRAFVQLGLWGKVRPLIYDGGDVQDDWELASVISRDDPLVKGVQFALGFSDEQVSDIIAAAGAAVA